MPTARTSGLVNRAALLFTKIAGNYFAKGDTLHEWEVPFDWPDDWPEAARAPFDAFHADHVDEDD